MKNLCKALCFLLVFVLIFTWLDNMFYSHDTGWEATDDWSGQQFDIVFMGNSHAYCSINPVIVNDALGLNTVVLASSNQPSEITYYTLKSLLKKTTPKALVIEANMLNSSVDMLYETKREGVLYSGISGFRDPLDRAVVVSRLIPVEHWAEAYSGLFRPLETWTRFSNWDSDYKPHGVLGYIPKDRFMADPVNIQDVERRYRESAGTRQIANTQADYKYMEKILQLAQKKEIPVYLIKCPIASFSVVNSDIMLDLTVLSENYPVVKVIHDYNLNLNEIGLTQNDFYDGGHLNNLGAVKFTEYLTRDIGQWFGIEPDFSRVGWFSGECCEPLSDGMYRYTVDLYDGCLVRFIAKNSDNTIIASTEFSRDNSIVLPMLGKDCRLSYELKASQPGSYTYDHPQTLSFILDPSPLKHYSANAIEIIQDGNTLTLTNVFDEMPVQYAWYVYKGNEPILKQIYTLENNNSFSYEFTETGDYKIQAFIRTMDKAETRSIPAVAVTVDDSGLSWKKP